MQLLVQIDKLVQLIESPVFTCASRQFFKGSSDCLADLRLQLLEPEKHPFLFKCLYGLLMTLPQSTAFVSLRNRLNAVSSMGFLHITPRVCAVCIPLHYAAPDSFLVLLCHLLLRRVHGPRLTRRRSNGRTCSTTSVRCR